MSKFQNHPVLLFVFKIANLKLLRPLKNFETFTPFFTNHTCLNYHKIKKAARIYKKIMSKCSIDLFDSNYDKFSFEKFGPLNIWTVGRFGLLDA